LNGSSLGYHLVFIKVFFYYAEGMDDKQTDEKGDILTMDDF